MPMSFLKKILFISFYREGREKERERNIKVWLLLCAPHWGSGPEPTHVP